MQRLAFGFGALLAAGWLAYASVAARVALHTWLGLASLACGVVGVVLLIGTSVLWARDLRVRARTERIDAASTIAALEARLERLADDGRATATVLEAVGSDLFVIDESFTIVERPASAPGGLFGDREFVGENLLHVLERALSETTFAAVRDCLTRPFDASEDEGSLANVLQDVEMTVVGKGGAALRFARFAFSRFATGASIARIVVRVDDVTERCMRERALRDSEREKARHLELLLGILHVPPADLAGFLQLGREQLAAMDVALTASDFGSAVVDQTALLRGRLDVVLDRLQTIGGNAALLRLDYFAREVKVLENRFGELRDRAALGGDDFLAVVSGLSTLRTNLDDLAALRAKVASIESAARVAGEVGDDLVTSLIELAANLANRAGKAVTIDADGFDSRALAPDRRLAIKDALVQLTRNAVLHGIESPEERLAAGKPRVATIRIRPMPNAPAGAFSFSFRDDGRGLDAVRIRGRAVEVGLLAEAERDAVGDSEVARFIFVPGFSTADRSTADAGPGMGMNVIKARIVDDCGGEIAVDSEAGAFCEFSFVLPARLHALAS